MGAKNVLHHSLLVPLLFELLRRLILLLLIVLREAIALVLCLEFKLSKCLARDAHKGCLGLLSHLQQLVLLSFSLCWRCLNQVLIAERALNAVLRRVLCLVLSIVLKILLLQSCHCLGQLRVDPLPEAACVE